jgi:hypothetical protein
MKKRYLYFLFFSAMAGSLQAQISLTGSAPQYNQDFNTLATSGTTNTNLPAGWVLVEAGANANGQYRAGDGSSNTGDTYSFGTGTDTERSLGGVASNNLQSRFGASFLNNTGNVINSFSLSYFGEQWRRGNTTAGKQDSLIFAYSTNATSLDDAGATWNQVNSLSFFSAQTPATASSLDGNAASNRLNLTGTVTLNLSTGATLWIRWQDINIFGSDDGLSADDVQMLFTTQGGGTPDTLVRFSPVSGTVAENAGSFNLSLLYNPTSPSTAFSALVALKSGNAADIGNFTTQTVNFPAGTNTGSLSVTLTDNSLQDGNKTFVFALRNPSAGMLLGADSLFTLTVSDDDVVVPGLPVYTIAQVRGTNANGGPDSLGVFCEVRGTVYGVNTRSTGLQFTMRDGTGGIGVFSPSNTFGYTVNEGDSIRLIGRVSVFRGLSQMDFLNVTEANIIPVGTGSIKAPTFVTALNESTESDLVRIANCTLVDAAQWTGSATGFNVQITDGNQVYTMRIAPNTTAVTMAAPATMFDVIGIGSQFATTTAAPFTDGYQIIPRKQEDILLGGSISENAESASMVVFPNPASERFTVKFEADGNTTAVVALKDLTGRTVMQKRIAVAAGTNQVELESRVASGVYLVTVECAQKRMVKRVLIK